MCILSSTGNTQAPVSLNTAQLNSTHAKVYKLESHLISIALYPTDRRKAHYRLRRGRQITDVSEESTTSLPISFGNYVFFWG